MKLFLIQKEDACGKYDAQYIVQAGTQTEALEKVNLTPDDIREMNEPYQGEPFPRYKVVVEEIEFNQDGFYLLDY
jgi:hypothetical protein